MNGNEMRHSISPPVQARPVTRDARDASVAVRNGSGVEAARTPCADLTGMARQMCYASRYGIST